MGTLRFKSWGGSVLGVILAALLLAGCGWSGSRTAMVPDYLAGQASVADMTQIRFWGDEKPSYLAAMAREKFAQTKASRPYKVKPGTRPTINLLTISGGGSDGAFGAGLLAGWSKNGTRPEFEVVTGISTGALIAPFAFLGKRYDPVLKEMYTTHTTRDFLKKQPVKGLLWGDALASNKPFQALIAKYLDHDLMVEIAKQHNRGRRLFIGTTNLDAQRPVIWDAGKIAASGHPDSLALLQKVFLASASVPGGFPPVMIRVIADGQVFEEMHVDGGTTHQVFLLPSEIDLASIDRKTGVHPRRQVYVIRNGRLNPESKEVRDRTIPIASRSISTLIKYQGIGDLYELNEYAQNNNIRFKLAYIPANFKNTSTEVFDPHYMGELYDLGYRLGRQGYRWRKAPPRTVRGL